MRCPRSSFPAFTLPPLVGMYARHPGYLDGVIHADKQRQGRSAGGGAAGGGGRGRGGLKERALGAGDEVGRVGAGQQGEGMKGPRQPATSA
eukprot:300684-Chlamydomonas_euryale.AAC.1